MFANLQTLGRPYGMGPHGLGALAARLDGLGIAGLGATASDWTMAYCTDSAGNTGVLCEWSPSLGVAWDDQQCDPNQSQINGACSDSEGTIVTPQPPIMAQMTGLVGGGSAVTDAPPCVNINNPSQAAVCGTPGSMMNPGTAAQQSATNSALVAQSAINALNLKNATSSNQAAPLTSTTGLPTGTAPGGALANNPPTATCSKTLISGVCDTTTYSVGAVVMIMMMILATRR
jgi:hypothetical protein